jgi:sugar-specific transcriptional regulator TrmB
MKIKEVLEHLNIEGKKADVYLACLEMGGATAYAIAKKVGLKRPTAYDVLNQLMNDGLVYKTFKKKIKYFFPADPDRLLKKIKEREEEIISIMPMLQNLYNAPKIKPYIRYFEGKEGIKEMYEDSLKSLKRGDEILAYVGDDVLKYLPQHASWYVSERVKRGIRLRGIYKNTGSILEYIKKNQEQLRAAKVLDEKLFPVQNETNIYGNKIAIASYGREMFGMIIESAEIAKAQKAVFELAWLGAEQILNSKGSE